MSMVVVVPVGEGGGGLKIAGVFSVAGGCWCS